jgi:hypothetical protein
MLIGVLPKERSMTRHVKFSVISGKVYVAAELKLPVGDNYEGYIEYDQSSGKESFAMIFLGDSQIAALKLTEMPKPIKFEVLRYIQSGDICIVED